MNSLEQMAEALAVCAALGDEELLGMLQTVLEERPAVLQGLVDWALPDHAYCPTKAISGKRVNGCIKSYNQKSGYGFIDSPDVKAVFGCDVFLHAWQNAGAPVGAQVNFAMLLNKDQKPQAFDVALGPGGSKGSGMAGAAGAMSQGKAGVMANAYGACAGGKGAAWGMQQGHEGAAWGMQQGHEGASWGMQQGHAAGAKGYGAGFGKAAAFAGKGAPAFGPGKDGGKAVFGGRKGKAAPTEGNQMAGVTDRSFDGTIKTFNFTKGFGFIECVEIQSIFGEGVDVFLHSAQMGNQNVGDVISFEVFLNKDDKPQGKNLKTMV